MSNRPITFDELIGQTAIKSQLTISIQAAKMQGKPMPHLLVSGPGGLGKTTIANCAATMMGTPYVVANATTLEKPDTLIDTICNIPRNGILFIDEIHNLDRVTQETLYTVMEDFQLVDKSMYGLQIQPFTLIGATTHAGKLRESFLTRFKMRCQIDYYTPTELAEVVKRSFGFEHTPAFKIGEVSRGIPRVAISYAEWIRDWCMVNGVQVWDEYITHALDAIGVDKHGLTPQDRQYLEVLSRNFRGGPAGLAAMAASMNTAVETLENEIEPFLLRNNYIIRTPRGRRLNQYAGYMVGRA